MGVGEGKSWLGASIKLGHKHQVENVLKGPAAVKYKHIAQKFVGYNKFAGVIQNDAHNIQKW